MAADTYTYVKDGKKYSTTSKADADKYNGTSSSSSSGSKSSSSSGSSSSKSSGSSSSSSSSNNFSKEYNDFMDNLRNDSDALAAEINRTQYKIGMDGQTADNTAHYERLLGISSGGGSSSGGSSGGGGSVGSSYSPVNYMDDISAQQRELAALQKKNLLKGLESAYNTNISGIQSARDKTPDQYNAAKNQANIQNKLAARNLKEYMANRGNTGENTQAQLMQQQGINNAMSTLSAQEQSALDELTRQENTLGQAYQLDRQAASAGADAQALQQTINLMMQEQQRQDQLAQLAQQQAMQQAQFSYQQTRDQLADSRYNQEWQSANDPNSIANQIKAAQLSALQLENQYLPQQLQLGLANQQSLISNRNKPSSGSSNGGTDGYEPGQGYTSTAQLSTDLSNLLKSSTYSAAEKRAQLLKLSQQYQDNPQMLEVIRRYSSYM